MTIVATLLRQLTWSHFVQIIALDDADERLFYEALAALKESPDICCRL